ncbi:MAG: efflux RND transporter periplasmic adaptor subunit [Candidatus Nitrotoga sp.]
MKFSAHPKIIVSVILLIALAGMAWWFIPKKISQEDRYVTVPLKRGSIAQTVSANGALNPVRLVSVGSQVSGIVKKLYVDFNDHVQAGQILLELDPSLAEAQLQQSKASVLSAEASLDLAQSNEARVRSLFSQEFVSRQELDQSVQALKLAQAQLAVAKAQAGRDRTNLINTVIRSPISGVVVSREVDLGQTVAASFTAPTLFKIAQDLGKMQIDSSYSEADVGKIRVGQMATFRVDAFMDKEFKGFVQQVRLNPKTEQNVVTYNVIISVENPEMLLMPGMTAYVSIATAQRDDALLVPNAALRFRPSEPIARGDKLSVPEVKTGDKNSTVKDSDVKKPEQRKFEDTKSPDKNQADKKTAVAQMQGPTSTIYVLENGQPRPFKIKTGITDNRHTEVVGGEFNESMHVIVEDKSQAAKKPVTGGMRFF